MGAGETSGLSNAGGGKQTLAESSRARLRRDGPSRADPSQTGPRHGFLKTTCFVQAKRPFWKVKLSQAEPS